MTYHIVPEADANVREKKISSISPVGKGLMNHKPGEVATIKTPAGEMQFEIIEITL